MKFWRRPRPIFRGNDPRPHFSHLFVTKRRKGRVDEARDPQAGAPEATANVLVQYVEEGGGTRMRVGGTRLAGRAVRTDYSADAVEKE